jgi:hypothetical protein
MFARMHARVRLALIFIAAFKVVGLQKQQKRNYFVVLADQITSLSKHYDDPTAENIGSIFFTPGSTVRRTASTEFTFTGADDEQLAVVAASSRECEEWLSVLIRTIEQFSHSLPADAADGGGGGGGGNNGSAADRDSCGHATPTSPADGRRSPRGGADADRGTPGGGPGDDAWGSSSPPASPSERLRLMAKRIASNRHSFKVHSNEYRVWVGTWNLGNEDPFKGVEPEQLQELLKCVAPRRVCACVTCARGGS